MRDVDCDFESIIVTKKDVASLENTRLLAGACDSPQAYVVPKYALQEIHGISSCKIDPQNIDVGKHGDTALGEVQAMQKLVSVSDSKSNKYDGALLSRMMWDRALAGQLEGVDAKKLQDEYHVYTDIQIPHFDHCQFDALASTNVDKLESFYTALHAMDYNDPVQQHIMKLEGIQKSWVKPRQEGYDIIRSAAAMATGGPRGSSSSTGMSFARALNYTPPGSSNSSRSFSTSTAAQEQSSSSAAAAATTTHKPTARSPDNKSRIGIIGCGVAGLQVIRSMRAHGFTNVTAFDKADDVGGLWRDNYDGYALQVGKQFFEMPDLQMTEAEWQELYIARFGAIMKPFSRHWYQHHSSFPQCS